MTQNINFRKFRLKIRPTSPLSGVLFITSQKFLVKAIFNFKQTDATDINLKISEPTSKQRA